jgi:uncharacterized BrkB/YihY/UPF0761 family membrane protein
MGDERADSAPPQLGRWLVIAVVLIVGIVLYFRLAPRTRPVVEPTPAGADQ